MSYEEELKKLYDDLTSEFSKIDELRKQTKPQGKDGELTKIRREAMRRYNAALVALKERHGIQ